VEVGNGKKVNLWEDNLLGPSILAIQFWEIYVLVNEKSQTIFDLWDGTNLKCTFRGGVYSWLMNLWLEVVQLASTIVFTDDEDSLIWLFNSNGVYSSQPFYNKIIEFRGIMPVPHVWNLKIPNKVLTREP
jgi:hypothetical protein